MSTVKEQMELGRKCLPAIKKLSKAVDQAIEEIGPTMTVYVLSTALYEPGLPLKSSKEQDALVKAAKQGMDRLTTAITNTVNEIGIVATVFQLEIAKSVVIEATAVEAIKTQHPE